MVWQKTTPALPTSMGFKKLAEQVKTGTLPDLEWSKDWVTRADTLLPPPPSSLHMQQMSTLFAHCSLVPFLLKALSQIDQNRTNNGFDPCPRSYFICQNVTILSLLPQGREIGVTSLGSWETTDLTADRPVGLPSSTSQASNQSGEELHSLIHSPSQGRACVQ